MSMKTRGHLYGVVYSILIAFVIAIVMGLVGPSLGGHPIMGIGFLNSLWQGTLVGGIVGIILPIPKIVGFYFDRVGAESKIAKTFVTCILLTTVFAIVMIFYFTAINTGFATFQTDAGPVTFMNRYMDGFAVQWAYIFVAAFVGDPIASTLAAKVTNFYPHAQAARPGDPKTDVTKA